MLKIIKGFNKEIIKISSQQTQAEGQIQRDRLAAGFKIKKKALLF